MLHASHPLLFHRGLYICTKCGYRAGKRVRKLAAPCLGLTDADRQRSLDAVLGGTLPRDLTMWPDERVVPEDVSLDLPPSSTPLVGW